MCVVLLVYFNIQDIWYVFTDYTQKCNQKLFPFQDFPLVFNGEEDNQTEMCQEIKQKLVKYKCCVSWISIYSLFELRRIKSIYDSSLQICMHVIADIAVPLKNHGVLFVFLVSNRGIKKNFIAEFESAETDTRHCRTRVYFQLISLRGNCM